MEDVVKNNGTFRLGFLLVAELALASQLSAQTPGATVTVWGSTSPIGTVSTYSSSDVLPSLGGGGVPTNDAEATGTGDMGGGGGGDAVPSATDVWRFVGVISNWAHREKRYVAHDIKKNWNFEITLKDCTVELTGNINSNLECNISAAKLALEGNISVEASVSIKAGFKYDLPKRRQAVSKLYGMISELTFLEQNIGLNINNNGKIRKAVGFETEFATYPVEQDLSSIL